MSDEFTSVGDEIPLDEKLDKCAEILIETYDQILILRQLLNTQLDNGFINLSKARSLLGCASLSIMQVPAELSANVTVDLAEGKVLVDDCFEYNKVDLSLKISENSKNETEAVTVTEKSLKNDETCAESKKALTSIPLPKWFGVLTPMSLKSSQNSFSSSLHVIKDLCELQIKFQSLRETYKKLLAEK